MPIQKLNQSTRDEVFRQVLDAVRSGTPATAGLSGHCLEFAWHGYQVLKSWPGAPRTLIQAGSCQWPRIHPQDDDGVSPTHFAYMWDPESELAQAITSGIVPLVRRADGYTAASLPEVHVWLACPDTGEVIDFTTGFWPEACRTTLGLDWPGPQPPRYLWCFGERCPRDVRYLSDRQAIDCVARVLRQQGRKYP